MKIISLKLSLIVGFFFLFALQANSAQAQSGFATAPVGFASLYGGTTGGVGGDTIVITSAQQLAGIMKPREKNITDPLVLLVPGVLTGFDDMVDFKRTGNITLLGTSDSSGFRGFGVKLVQSSNIIVRNLTFADCRVEEKDGLTIDRCSNVWVDHCTFTDSPASDPGGDDHDGLLDVKKGSYNITLSNNYFNNHRKTALLGHSRNETGDVDIKVTYYRNWFDGTYSRHPRTRYGRVHLLNNLYTNIGGYGVGVTCAAQVFLEGNFFENTPTPVLISQVNDAGRTLSGDPEGFIKSEDNTLVNSGPIVENLAAFDFDPASFYNYEADSGSAIKQIVQANAGAGRLDFSTGVHSQPMTEPASFRLHQNYPNPFRSGATSRRSGNPSTTIMFALDKAGFVDLAIFDITGRRIETLVKEQKSAGTYAVEWQANAAASGVYLCKMQVGQHIQTMKLVVVK